MLENVRKKGRKEEEGIFFQKMAEDDIATEQAMENYFFEKYQLSPAKQILPTLVDYVAFLKQTLEDETSRMAIAALFPCFGLYSGMTYYIYQRANTENKYQDWIELIKMKATQTIRYNLRRMFV